MEPAAWASKLVPGAARHWVFRASFKGSNFWFLGISRLQPSRAGQLVGSVRIIHVQNLWTE